MKPSIQEYSRSEKSEIAGVLTVKYSSPIEHIFAYRAGNPFCTRITRDRNTYWETCHLILFSLLYYALGCISVILWPNHIIYTNNILSIQLRERPVKITTILLVILSELLTFLLIIQKNNCIRQIIILISFHMQAWHQIFLIPGMNLVDWSKVETTFANIWPFLQLVVYTCYCTNRL